MDGGTIGFPRPLALAEYLCALVLLRLVDDVVKGVAAGKITASPAEIKSS